MRYLLLFFISIMSFVSCTSNFNKEELYGSWANADWAFTFNKDKTCKVASNGVEFPGDKTFKTFGNTLEFIREGKIFLSNITIKSLEGNTLTLEMRSMFTGSDTTSKLIVLKKK